MRLFAVDNTLRHVLHGEERIAQISRPPGTARWLMTLDAMPEREIDVTNCNSDPMAILAVIQRLQPAHSPLAELEKLFAADGQETG